MRMKKTTVYLITLFVLLFAITFFVILPTEDRTASYSLNDSFFSIDSGGIYKIKIRRAFSNISFEKSGENWKLTEPVNYLADQEAIYSLLASASKLKINSLVSSNPTKQTLYQVDTITGTQLKFHNLKENIVSLIVGKMGPSYLESYIRAENSDDVYLAEGLNSWILNKEVRDWRDKTIYKTEKDSIKQLYFEFDKDKFITERIENKWVIGIDSIPSATIDNLLSTLSNFRTEDFIDTNLTLPQPQLKLEIVSTNKTNLFFYPIQPDSSRYWIVSSNSPQIFVVGKYSANQIIKTKKELVK